MNPVTERILPVLNEAIHEGIKAAGLDPLEKVTSGSLQIPGTLATLDYEVVNMKNLSTLKIDDLDFSDIKKEEGSSTWDKTTKYTAKSNFNGQIEKDLNADINGDLVLYVKIATVSGNIAIVKSTFKGDADVKFDVTKRVVDREADLCIREYVVQELSFDFEDIAIKVEGIDPSDYNIDAIKAEIIESIKKEGLEKIEAQAKDAINEAIKQALPKCYTLSLQDVLDFLKNM